ncbi:MAG: TrkH family potassium uptake protein [Treponema sp.]|jgi:trk system potassium uptake protein TrkH|nr:TrkH family potassium uptake protein [Treponema sp.]
MNRAVILRIAIYILGILALIMLVPLVMAAILGEVEMLRAFGIPIALMLAAAIPTVILSHGKPVSFSTADGFLLVFLAWVLICLLGALPFALSGYFDGFTDAVFESTSGFTTTGATMLGDVEAIPRSLVFWRALTHWLGGMGIVVLMVALLPVIGVGGFQLLRAESPGPETDRIAPRITRTAGILWSLYLGLTVLQILLLRLGGMSWFDAAFHAFSTMGSGGFSSMNNSIASYHSPWIEWVCIVFMTLAGFNFTLIYQALRGRFSEIINNSEAKAYAAIILISVSLVTLSLLFQDSGAVPATLGENIRYAFFQVTSTLSTTGLSATDQDLWPPLAKGVIFLLMFIGGCSGSTAGGIKIIRHIILFKQTGNEMKRLIYPKGVFSIRLNNTTGRKDAVYGVAGFVFLYLLLVLVTFVVVSTSGTDLFSALNVALISLGNIGMGFGKMDSLIHSLPDWQKWFLSLMMIAGRLELWSAFVCFSRDYWRR